VEFYLNISAIYTKWCAQTFPPIFRLFAIFNCNFAKIVAPLSNKDKNYLAKNYLALLKKRLKTTSKSTHKPTQNLLKVYPLKRTACRRRSVKKNIKKTNRHNKHHIFAPIAGARCTIFPKFCTAIEHIETIKKVAIIFRSNVQFFLQGARKNSG